VEENRVLKDQVKGRRLRLTDDQRRRLAIKRGLVTGKRHDFQAHRRVWWLEIPETIAARLEQLARMLKRV
jgi:hypothetical protein